MTPKHRNPRPVLLLDVMDTLVADPAYEVVLPFFGLEKAEFFRLKSKEAYDAFERGTLTEEEFRRRYFHDGRDFDLEGLKAELRRGYRFIDGIPALLGDLVDRGYAMHALSNYSVWSEMIEEELRLSRWLSWDYVSHRTGHRKPEPDAYLTPARDLGLSPERFVFVDDRQKNVDGARAVGMQAIHFQSAAQLRAALLGDP